MNDAELRFLYCLEQLRGKKEHKSYIKNYLSNCKIQAFSDGYAKGCNETTTGESDDFIKVKEIDKDIIKYKK